MKKLLLVLIMCFALCATALAAVNINTASKEELTSLKGVGEKRAQAIIDYRTKNGPFKTADDLEKVPGIGPGIMKQIKSQISVSGPTTVEKPAASTKSKTTTDSKTTKPADTKSTTKSSDTGTTKSTTK